MCVAHMRHSCVRLGSGSEDSGVRRATAVRLGHHVLVVLLLRGAGGSVASGGLIRGDADGGVTLTAVRAMEWF